MKLKFLALLTFILVVAAGLSVSVPSAFAGGCSSYTIQSPSGPYTNANGAWLIDSRQWTWQCGASNFRVEGRAEVNIGGSWQFLADSPRYAPSSTGYYSGGNPHTGNFTGYEVAYPGTSRTDVCAYDYRIHYDISFSNGSQGYSDNSPALQC